MDPADPAGLELTHREVQSVSVVRYPIPQRESDSSGRRPSWYPIQWNVCDEDDPDPLPLTRRQKSIH